MCSSDLIYVAAFKIFWFLIRRHSSNRPVLEHHPVHKRSMRGVKKPGAKTTTRAVRGCFTTDADARAEALSLIFR